MANYKVPIFQGGPLMYQLMKNTSFLAVNCLRSQEEP